MLRCLSFLLSGDMATNIGLKVELRSPRQSQAATRHISSPWFIDKETISGEE